MRYIGRLVFGISSLLFLTHCSSVKSDGPVPLFLAEGEEIPAKVPEDQVSKAIDRGASLKGTRVTVTPLTEPFRLYEANAEAFKKNLGDTEWGAQVKDLKEKFSKNASCFRIFLTSGSYDGAKLDYWQFRAADKAGTSHVVFTQTPSPSLSKDHGFYTIGRTIYPYVSRTYFNYGLGCTDRKIDFSGPFKMELEARFKPPVEVETVSWEPKPMCMTMEKVQGSVSYRPLPVSDSDCCNTNSSCVAGCKSCNVAE